MKVLPEVSSGRLNIRHNKWQKCSDRNQNRPKTKWQTAEVEDVGASGFLKVISPIEPMQAIYERNDKIQKRKTQKNQRVVQMENQKRWTKGEQQKQRDLKQNGRLKAQVG